MRYLRYKLQNSKTCSFLNKDEIKKMILILSFHIIS